MRIVTLLPSATEIVCALGLREQLVGVSHSCDFPADVAELAVMTSTRVPVQRPSDEIDSFVRDHLGEGNDALYDLHADRLAAAAPDVIVSQALCDVCAVSTGDVASTIAALPTSPVLIDLNPQTLDDVFADIERVGQSVGRAAQAAELVSSLRSRKEAVVRRTKGIPEVERPRVAFLEWLLPPFSAGHWMPELLRAAGAVDVLGRVGEPSATVTWEAVAGAEADVLFVACCGFDIERTREDVDRVRDLSAWRGLPAVEQGRVYLADGGAYFSSPGPRLIDGLELLAHALHPRVHPQPNAGIRPAVVDGLSA
ncbi:MAG: ABC transporter substrate-binding protein [Pseudomonadota bacterium]